MNDIHAEFNQMVGTAQNAKNKKDRAEAMEQIYKKLEPFRFALAKKFANKGVEFDDLTQQIDLKLIEAICDYDSEKDPSALRHLVSRVRNGIWNYYRKEMNYFNMDKKTLSLDEIRYREGGTGNDIKFDLYHTFVNQNPEFNDERILDRIVFEQGLLGLTEHQQEVLFMSFIDDMTQYDIAELLGINQSNVSRAKRRGVEAIRDSFIPCDEFDDSF